MTTQEVLILTPMKDAAGFLEGYFANLERLSYPGERLSLGMLESDSADDTFAKATALAGTLADRFASVHLWKHDYGFRYPPVLPRWWPPIQRQRRSILARSRNRLLFRALRDHHWVLWLDVDVVEYPADVLARLLATGKRIVQPNCVTEFGGESFDKNAWRGRRKAFLSDLRDDGDIVALDSVGGTMLLVDADLHRDGLVFPPFPYGQADRKRIPADVLRMETEGLALMARDMGETCWGLPNLEIRHHPG
jgi:hypothetical protein